MREPLALIGLVTPDGRLVTMRISVCALSIARAQGWMVFNDFERLAVMT
jgi:hypothetical protein